ncbi:MAG TPA: oxygen-independent coproporphyrinogen III oxidase [Bacteroidia bacterium]|nr:oxygen-independent coproporphyrinogen III oxidase [Bacteroidia bacterium]
MNIKIPIKSAFSEEHNIQAPRYTSYPTVPYWDNALVETVWKQKVRGAFQAYGAEGISLYIHLPFCESLCTYCACNTRITVNHAVEEPYIMSLLKEWRMYLGVLGSRPRIKELHLGGGTPTFFSPENLNRLISSILSDCDMALEHSFSFEGHPANTRMEHLKALAKLGFNRVSFGVQDFDPLVQDAINRYQTFEEVEQVMRDARSLNYRSVNIDLVYGLPFQSTESVRDTVEKIIQLKPERIAFYSYAHVPWLKPGQRKYSEKDLPADSVKRALYDMGKELLAQAGYVDVGMDHFALPGDELYRAYFNKSLHRNFMGYTEQHTKLLIGLGVSSISDSLDGFAQNVKTLEKYQEMIQNGHLPVFKGHSLNAEDLRVREHILDLMCRYETKLDEAECRRNPELVQRLQALFERDWIQHDGSLLLVKDSGRPYLRNICLAFDERYWRKIPEKATFSTTA